MIFTNLYVKNFDTETTTEEKLTELFGKYGEITSIKLIQDQAGKLLGFGFINFKNPDDAQNVLDSIKIELFILITIVFISIGFERAQRDRVGGKETLRVQIPEEKRETQLLAIQI